MSRHALDRRTFIRGASGTALAAAAAPALAACGTGSDPAKTNEANSKVALPTYKASEGAKPDLPGSNDGVLPGFFHYPANPPKVTDGGPGLKGGLDAMMSTTAALAPPMGRNRYWQELNTRAGCELRFNFTPVANYADKVATVLAGGELPDTVMVQGVARLDQILKASFQDLTEFLSGDAILEFPFLAAMPTYSWRNAIFNGGIYGIPNHRGIILFVSLTRQDLLEKYGLTDPVNSGQDFIDLCTELALPKENRWAVSNIREVIRFFHAMLGAPNGWRADNGKFTHVHETEEAKTALETVAGMWKNNLFHPDSLAAEESQRKAWFNNGAAPIYIETAASWLGFVKGAKDNDPNLRVGVIPAPGFQSGKGTQFLGGGSNHLTILKKANKDRIRDILRLLNWFATPFGTQEHLFRSSGLQGVHHTLNGTDPVLTPTGKNETTVPQGYFAAAPSVLYSPESEQAVRDQHAFQTEVAPRGVPNASIGLYSNTASVKNAALEKIMDSLVADIVQGRKPVSAWDAGVKDWRTTGGDAMRGEFEKAYELVNGN